MPETQLQATAKDLLVVVQEQQEEITQLRLQRAVLSRQVNDMFAECQRLKALVPPDAKAKEPVPIDSVKPKAG